MVINGNENVIFQAEMLDEVTKGKKEWVDVIGGDVIVLEGEVTLAPNKVLLLEPYK
jgi:hypothetical protein